MHDPKLIDAMAKASREAWRDLCDNRADTVEWQDVDDDEREMCVTEATAALDTLCTIRPDVAVLLQGGVEQTVESTCDRMPCGLYDVETDPPLQPPLQVCSNPDCDRSIKAHA